MPIPEAALSALTLRHSAYTLLARLFLAPPDGALLLRLAQLPPFDALLRNAQLSDALVESYAAHYQALFGFTLFPYESVFLGRDLMVNGDIAAGLEAQMQRFGFEVAQHGGEPPDHIGMEMAFMGHLIALQRDALRRHNLRQAETAHRAQSELLHQHLGRWLPVALLTMRAVAPVPLYRLVADVTLELILDDLQHASVQTQEREIAEPAIHLPVWEEDDGLAAVIRPLLTPVESGLFLTREEIRAIACELQLPLSMGGRAAMLKTLFEAAGQFDSVTRLLAALQALWHQRQGELRRLIESAPVWSIYGQDWLSRLEQGMQLLASLKIEWSCRES